MYLDDAASGTSIGTVPYGAATADPAKTARNRQVHSSRARNPLYSCFMSDFSGTQDAQDKRASEHRWRQGDFDLLFVQPAPPQIITVEAQQRCRGSSNHDMPRQWTNWNRKKITGYAQQD